MDQAGIPMRLKLKGLEIDVRPGTADDIPLLLEFIRSMAEFEKLEVTATEKTLRESLFGDRPAAHVLFVFADGKPVAYTTYFFSFSSMVGKRGLWVDDLYVDPDFRGKGIARALIACLADVALKNKCGRCEWIVLDWNKAAIDLYHRIGARALNEWRIWRLDESDFDEVARSLKERMLVD
jgi:GNAT superfamily N-acetyltransferase